MKENIIVTLLFCGISMVIHGQAANLNYPEPEFKNEVYFLDKGNNKLIRLEKGSSKMETKTKMGGMGGSESGYDLDGSKSGVRLNETNNISFVFSTGASPSTANQRSDSIMRANGVDPSMMSEMRSMTDPTNMITLYKVNVQKGIRKVLLQKSGGALPFSNHKTTSSDKYSISMKRIREGYWELVVDKHLPKGEYAFTLMGLGGTGGDATLFSFGID